MTTISELQKEIHQVAKDKGWYDGKQSTFLERIALVHSELSEAVESWRNSEPSSFIQENGKPEGWAVELADAVIRILDMSDYFDIDLELLIARKMAYNKTREYRHGGKRA